MSQSVGIKQVTCNPKINCIHFSAIELGGFHGSVVRRGSKGSGWAVLVFTNDF